jgi:hypothetical protein
MWVHLGGPNWQRASFDAVVVIAGFLGLLCVAPSWRQLRPRHGIVMAVLAALTVAFVLLLRDSLSLADERLRIRLERIEAEAPP